MTGITLTRRGLGAGLAASLLPWRAAWAAWPEAPIKWIVAYAAGGGTDTLARLIGAAMSSSLGRPVVIDNRPGAATNIGAEAAAKAAPDGYTVFTADNGTLVFNPALFRNLPYNPERDFRPVGAFARFHLVLAVRKSSDFSDVKSFIAAGKERQGRIDYASPGIGSPHHLTMERLARSTGARFNHIPYRGAAPALNDLIAGTVESTVIDYASGGEALRSGMVRPLAIFSNQRLAALPDVPTVTEALGLERFEAYAWQSLVVPKATPDPIVERLTQELQAAVGQESVQKRMREIGLEPLQSGPEEVQALLAAERAVWVPLIRELGITLD